MKQRETPEEIIDKVLKFLEIENLKDFIVVEPVFESMRLYAEQEAEIARYRGYNRGHFDGMENGYREGYAHGQREGLGSNLSLIVLLKDWLPALESEIITRTFAFELRKELVKSGYLNK